MGEIDYEVLVRRISDDLAARAAQIRSQAYGDQAPARAERMEIGDAAFQEADRRYVRRLLEAQLEMLRQKRRRT